MHAVKFCAPRVITVRRLFILSNAVPVGRQLDVHAVKCCAARVIAEDTIGRVRCQMLWP